MSGTQSSLTTSGSTQNMFSSLGAGNLPAQTLLDVPQSLVQLLNFTAQPYQSGTTFLLGAPTASRVISLPAVASCIGTKFRFVCSANGGGGFTWTLTPATSVLYGNVQVGSAGATSSVVKSAAASLVLTATRLIGDHIELECDGLHWYVSGSGSAAASFS